MPDTENAVNESGIPTIEITVQSQTPQTVDFDVEESQYIRTPVDDTLSIAGMAADAKATGDRFTDAEGDIDALETDVTALETAVAAKVNKPATNPNGTSGQVLKTNGDGTTAWIDRALPTDAQTAVAVSAWLAAHPEATTTVQDGAITYAKLDADLKAIADNDAVNIKIVTVSSPSTTLGDMATMLNTINTAHDHVFFDLSALGVMMYLCTIFIDTANNVYKVFDLVSGRYAEGAYDAAMLLTMATAQANGLAVQSQINYLQNEIDALGGKSVLANWDALGDKIADGTSTDLITPGDSIEINWIKTVLGTTTSGLTVACSDIQAFADEMGEAEAKDYLFVYNGTAWTYNGEVVDLADYALTVTGTPATGEVMDIKTTVTGDLYTFTGYDDVEAADPNVPHNWLLEKTYAPSTNAFDAYESLFCIQAGKSIAAGKYYLPLYSWRSGKTFNACFELSAALGNESSKVQLARAASGSAKTVDATGATVAGAYYVTSLSPVLFGTATSAGSAVAVTYMSTADAEAGGYTLLSTLNADAADPVYTAGDFDQAALGDNCWPNSNLCQHLNSEAQNGGYTPSHDNDIASAYNRQAGFLYGMDPRVKKLIQYAAVKWTAGRGNPNTSHYTPATGTAPAADAPTYYQRGGVPGARTYTALDPQPAAGDDVSAYYIHEGAYVYNKTYTAEQRVFLLSFKEMGFATVNTGEGNITDLYKEYCGGAATDSAVAARAKYNKAGGTLNNYRWARSALVSGAGNVRSITPSGGSGNGACYANYYAPAFIVGKSINPA